MNEGKKSLSKTEGFDINFLGPPPSKNRPIDESSIICLCVSITSYFRTPLKYLVSIVTDNNVFANERNRTAKRDWIGLQTITSIDATVRDKKQCRIYSEEKK